MKPLHTPNEKIKMDVAGSCVLCVSKYFHLLLKFPLGVAKKPYRIVNTMVNLDSFYGETFPHPLKSLVSICPVTDKPKVLLNLPFCPARGLRDPLAGMGAKRQLPRGEQVQLHPSIHPPPSSHYQHKQKYIARRLWAIHSQFPSHHPTDLQFGTPRCILPISQPLIKTSVLSRAQGSSAFSWRG